MTRDQKLQIADRIHNMKQGETACIDGHIIIRIDSEAQFYIVDGLTYGYHDAWYLITGGNGNQKEGTDV